MDALKNLANNIPDWQKRLDDLNGQIEPRQLELAGIALSDAASVASPRSVRSKGSLESFNPQDDGPMPPDFHLAQASSQPQVGRQAVAKTPSIPLREAAAAPESRPKPSSNNLAALHKQACEAVAYPGRVEPRVKKKRKFSSIIFAKCAPLTCQTRGMIAVYYDSHVQEFFNELVTFISSSRNLMRKAKMAAKVAQIKRMAESRWRAIRSGWATGG